MTVNVACPLVRVGFAGETVPPPESTASVPSTSATLPLASNTVTVNVIGVPTVNGPDPVGVTDTDEGASAVTVMVAVLDTTGPVPGTDAGRGTEAVTVTVPACCVVTMNVFWPAAVFTATEDGLVGATAAPP